MSRSTKVAGIIGVLILAGGIWAAKKAGNRYAQKRVEDAIRALDPQQQALAIKFDSVEFSLLKQSVVIRNLSIIQDSGTTSQFSSAEFEDCRKFKSLLPVHCTVTFLDPQISVSPESDALLESVLNREVILTELDKKQQTELMLAYILHIFEEEEVKTDIHKIVNLVSYNEQADHRVRMRTEVTGKNNYRDTFELDFSGVSSDKLSHFVESVQALSKASESDQMSLAFGLMFQGVALARDLTIHRAEVAHQGDENILKTAVAAAMRFRTLTAFHDTEADDEDDQTDDDVSIDDTYKAAASLVTAAVEQTQLSEHDRDTLNRFIDKPKSLQAIFAPTTPIKVGMLVETKMLGGALDNGGQSTAQSVPSVKPSDFKLILNGEELGLSKI